MKKSPSPFRHPLLWVPSLYLAMGIPFNVINYTSSTMYKSLGLSDGQITVSLGSIVVVWLGRRRIAGIAPGRAMEIQGRIGQHDGQRIMYNPRYELMP